VNDNITCEEHNSTKFMTLDKTDTELYNSDCYYYYYYYYYYYIMNETTCSQMAATNLKLEMKW